MENCFFFHPRSSPVGATVYIQINWVQGLLTPAFRPGIKGCESRWGFCPKHKKGYDFMKEYRLERDCGLKSVDYGVVHLNPALKIRVSERCVYTLANW